MIAAPISKRLSEHGFAGAHHVFVVVVIGGIGSVAHLSLHSWWVIFDTLAKCSLPSISGMMVYMLMAATLLYRPEGLFKQ